MLEQSNDVITVLLVPDAVADDGLDISFGEVSGDGEHDGGRFMFTPFSLLNVAICCSASMAVSSGECKRTFFTG